MSLETEAAGHDAGTTVRAGLKQDLGLAMIIMALVVLGLGGLSAFVSISGAVIAAGHVAVESRVKQIQHPTGGVVAEILVRDGDTVRRNQLLMRLDTTVSGNSASLSGQSVDQLAVREVRLQAERDDRDRLAFPRAIMGRRQEPAVAAAVLDETRAFQLRRQALRGQLVQLRERVVQQEAQIVGYQTQAEASREQSRLIAGELDGLRKLWAQRLVSLPRLNALEREAVELKSRAAALDASIAQSRAAIAELNQQMITTQQQSRSEAASELGDVQQRLADLRRNNVVAEDSHGRMLIRAPQDGVVDKLTISTVGGVVPPGQTIMEIVPVADRLLVEARVSPVDIDQVRPDQPARLRFSAFNQQVTPEIGGKVSRVSPELATDERTGATYYTVMIEIDPREIGKLGGLRLLPGMPVEAFVRTGRRSLLSYVTKPLADQIARAFRAG